METIQIKINNVSYEVPAGSTILESAHSVGVKIPTLCYLNEINGISACGICVVEVKGACGLVKACAYPVSDGMEIVTNSEKVQAARRTNLESLLSTQEQAFRPCLRIDANNEKEYHKQLFDALNDILVRVYLPSVLENNTQPMSYEDMMCEAFHEYIKDINCS